jgi:hypothetical protein
MSPPLGRHLRRRTGPVPAPPGHQLVLTRLGAVRHAASAHAYRRLQTVC